MNERIKEIRKSMKLTQEDFGKKIGLKQNTIALIESGKRNTSDQTVKAICREFGVNYFWLTEGTGDMFVGLPDTLIDEIAIEYDLDDFEKNMIIEYLKLTKDQRSVLKQYIKNITKKDLD